MIVSPSPDPATRPFRAAYPETSWAHSVDSRTRKHGTFSCLSIIDFILSVTSRRESYSQQPCCTDHLDTACRCSTQFPSSCKHLQPMYSNDTKQDRSSIPTGRKHCLCAARLRSVMINPPPHHPVISLPSRPRCCSSAHMRVIYPLSSKVSPLAPYYNTYITRTEQDSTHKKAYQSPP